MFGSSWVQTNEVHFIYDGNLVIQERDGNNLPQVTYTRGEDLSGSLQGAGGIGGLLARTANPLTISSQLSTFATAMYHSDGNGNVTCLLYTNQIVAAKYIYDPFGNTLAQFGTLADANLYRFSSKDRNGNSGLYAYGLRFYDPNLQRWLNQDPIQEAGGINLYDYVANDPINLIDALGLDWTDYIPDWVTSQGLVNFAAGAGDSLSFGLTDRARNALGINDAVDKCAGTYNAGQWTGTGLGLAIGGGRLAYAALARAKSVALLADGATEANALKAFQYRNTLKRVFNLGMTGPLVDEEYMLGKYGTDWAGWISAAGRTATGTDNALFGIKGSWNILGGYFAGTGDYGVYKSQ